MLATLPTRLFVCVVNIVVTLGIRVVMRGTRQSEIDTGMDISGSVLSTLPSPSLSVCGALCAQSFTCLSAEFNPTTNECSIFFTKKTKSRSAKRRMYSIAKGKCSYEFINKMLWSKIKLYFCAILQHWLSALIKLKPGNPKFAWASPLSCQAIHYRTRHSPISYSFWTDNHARPSDN